jgi:hypothetical protein
MNEDKNVIEFGARILDRSIVRDDRPLSRLEVSERLRLPVARI